MNSQPFVTCVQNMPKGLNAMLEKQLQQLTTMQIFSINFFLLIPLLASYWIVSEFPNEI